MPWGEALLSMAAAKEQHDSATGQVLQRGLSAKIGISNGPITRLCPHAVTGRYPPSFPALPCPALPCPAFCMLSTMTGGN